MKIPSANDPNLPFSFRLARAIHTLLDGGRGSHRLYGLLMGMGWLQRAGRFSFFGKDILIPLKVPETLFVRDWSLFHGLREVNFANEINRTLEAFTLLDCGAYFGQVSMRVANLCPRLNYVMAVDANKDSCEVLEANLAMTAVSFRVFNVAVSHRPGHGTLTFPAGPNDPDSAYIERSDNGPIQIQTLDDLVNEVGTKVAGKDIALKLDVEGEEAAAIAGARNLISNARRICFFIELHPQTLQRRGQTAEGLLGSVSKMRPVKWYVAHRPYIEIDINRPVFEQIGGETICDVIGAGL